MGRWGFIDRMFHDMGGRPTDAGRLENAWLVDYQKGAGDLGKMLAEQLDLKQADLSQFGTIFDIKRLSAPDEPADSSTGSRKRHPTPRARRLDSPEH